MSGIFTCKDCPNRYPGCHGQCEKYKREKAEYERRKAIAYEGKESEAYLITQVNRRKNDSAIWRKRYPRKNKF